MGRKASKTGDVSVDVTLHSDRKITINDVARLANVSKKTVSRVINNSPLVSDDTRRRVQAVIQAHAYTPDPQARALALRRSFLIGMIYDNPSPQYVVNVQGGILDALAGSGYLLVLQPVDRSAADIVQQVESFVTQQRPTGVILTPSISEDERIADVLRAADCPYVRVASVPLDEAARMVRTHDHEGAREAGRHLTTLGHTRIAHVHGPNSFRSAHERRRGFEEGLAEAGLFLSPGLTIEGEYTFDSGVAATRRLLSLDPRPTAIFFGNDEMAIGAYEAVRDAGLTIPDDVSIVGYDDAPTATLIWPKLTTVRVAMRELGGDAARLLLAGQDGRPEAPAARLEYFPDLVVRGSTRALTGAA